MGYYESDLIFIDGVPHIAIEWNGSEPDAKWRLTQLSLPGRTVQKLFLRAATEHPRPLSDAQPLVGHARLSGPSDATKPGRPLVSDIRGMLPMGGSISVAQEQVPSMNDIEPRVPNELAQSSARHLPSSVWLNVQAPSCAPARISIWRH
jgi:hypothetical protein